jgi:hypothetical protein
VVDAAVVSEAVAGLLAAGGVTQHVRAGRDAYAAGRNQTVIDHRRPDGPTIPEFALVCAD